MRDILQEEAYTADSREKHEALIRLEEAKNRELDEDGKSQEEIEALEFDQLVAEIRPLDYSESSQVSRYIMKHKLGYKYRNISGIVKMKRDVDTWDFKGGFPPYVFARLCSELGLKSKKSAARVVGFTPFKNAGY